MKVSPLLPSGVAISLALFLAVSGDPSLNLPGSGALPGLPRKLKQQPVTSAAESPIARAYGKWPIYFEPNVGQAPAGAPFLSRIGPCSLLLASAEAALHCPNSQTVMRTQFVGAQPGSPATGLDELPGKIHYFLGSDPKRWRTHIPTFSKVRFHNIYPGVDLVYHGRQGTLEYDFLLRPGTDPKAITLAFEGAEGVALTDDGHLILKTAAGEMQHSKPVIYQQTGGVRREIPGSYRFKGNNQVGFQIGAYDTRLPLVIDPVLVFSTHLGGSGTESGKGVAVDAAGNVYVVGETTSLDFPANVPFSPGRARGDVFVAKLNPAGSALLYATYLGGFSFDFASGIAVDSAGSAYAAGWTNSFDFPVRNAFQDHYGGGESDAWIAKLDASGSLAYSTYLGTSGGASSGVDTAQGIAVDAGGSAYVIGATGSMSFPTVNPVQPGCAGYIKPFVAKFNPAGSALLYSSCFRGGFGPGIAVDAAGSAYLAGASLEPGSGAVITKLSADGTTVVYSTDIAGGSLATAPSAIAVDSAGNAYATGTTSAADFPAVRPLQPALAGGSDAFVIKLSPAGTPSYSTYLGGSGRDSGRAIAVDAAGNVHVAGETSSLDFPTASAVQASNGGAPCADAPCEDAFFAKLNPSGTALVYSTYLGGSGSDAARGVAADSLGNTYGTGTTSGPFPSVNALPGSPGGSTDAFVVKIGEESSAAIRGTLPRFLPTVW